MTDIFICYSKADHGKAVKLAAYLESEGWTVWWDKNLSAGDIFRDEIMRQLAVARAVIVLWTHNSIKSDFVRAEAGRAKADGKLVPVKEKDVTYGDIPLPFGEMHTEDISKLELIRSAIVTQLAKPSAQPSALRAASTFLRYQVLTWIGIIGGCITLFANLRGILAMAEWAKWLSENWNALTKAIWSTIFWYAPVLSQTDANVLTIIAFAMATCLSSIRDKQAGQLTKGTTISVLIAGLLIAYIFVQSASRPYLSEHLGFLQTDILRLLSLPEKEISSSMREFGYYASISGRLDQVARDINPFELCARADQEKWRHEYMEQQYKRWTGEIAPEAPLIPLTWCMVYRNSWNHYWANRLTHVVLVAGLFSIGGALVLIAATATRFELHAKLIARRLWITIGILTAVVGLNYGGLSVEEWLGGHGIPRPPR